MKHIIYHVQVETLHGWKDIFSDCHYIIAQVSACALMKYYRNAVQITNPALGYTERIR
jgi:hypothetical protein